MLNVADWRWCRCRCNHYNVHVHGYHYNNSLLEINFALLLCGAMSESSCVWANALPIMQVRLGALQWLPRTVCCALQDLHYTVRTVARTIVRHLCTIACAAHTATVRCTPQQALQHVLQHTVSSLCVA